MKKKLYVILTAVILFAVGANKVNAAHVDFYDEEDGEVISTMENVFNIPVPITVEAPEREGYVFLGWDTNDTNVFLGQENNTVNVPWTIWDRWNFNNRVPVFATWEIVEYTIEYELDGGEAEGNPESYTILDEVSITNPTKEGYKFLGWLNEDGENLGTDLVFEEGTTGDMFLTAAWEKNPETVVTPTETKVVTKNPKTSDNVLFNIGLISASVLSVIGIKILDKKNVSNN